MVLQCPNMEHPWLMEMIGIKSCFIKKFLNVDSKSVYFKSFPTRYAFSRTLFLSTSFNKSKNEFEF